MICPNTLSPSLLVSSPHVLSFIACGEARSALHSDRREEGDIRRGGKE